MAMNMASRKPPIRLTAKSSTTGRANIDLFTWKQIDLSQSLSDGIGWYVRMPLIVRDGSQSGASRQVPHADVSRVVHPDKPFSFAPKTA